MGVTIADVSLTTIGVEIASLMMIVGFPDVKRLRRLPVALTSSVAQAVAAKVNPARRIHTRPAQKVPTLSAFWEAARLVLEHSKETLKQALTATVNSNPEASQQGSSSTMAVAIRHALKAIHVSKLC